VWSEQRERAAVAYLSALVTRGVELDMWAALQEGRQRFDDALAADATAIPAGVDDDEMEVRRLLGVA
jgi:hypothetical protein